MSSGVARLARVSTSRDLEISQFWQNLHARLDVALNPAVVEAMPVFRRDGEPVVFGNEWGHGVLSAPGYAPRSQLNTCWWSRPLGHGAAAVRAGRQKSQLPKKR